MRWSRVLHIVGINLTTRRFDPFKKSHARLSTWEQMSGSSEHKPVKPGHENTPQLVRTAGIIIIGDEILKGFTKDTNSHFLVCELYKLGVKVKKDNPSPNRCLGVFGMSLYTTERDLRETFDKYGPIEDVQLVFDHPTGRSRGFGFIYFENIEDAIDARDDATDMELDGHRIRVDYSMSTRPHTPTPGQYMGRPDERRGGYGGGGDYYRGGGGGDCYNGGGGGRGRGRSPSPRRDRSASYTPPPRGGAVGGGRTAEYY